MKKLLYLIAALVVVLGFSSCKLDYFPSDELNSDALLGSDAGAEYIIDGCYAMLKEQYEYVEYESGNSYIRHYMMDAEYPSDNICLSGQTTDPLAKATWYKMTDNLKNIETLWWVGYKIIYTANTVIETLEKTPEADRLPATNQLLGEAYFLRGMVHFHLVNLFACQYVLGRDNKGIPLRTSTNTSETSRASVGEVYDQIVKDLRKAADLMDAPRHTDGKKINPAYATKNTALGLLSRVYLYMGDKNQEVLDVIKEMPEPTGKLDGDYPTYFANALDREETLLAVAHTVLEDRSTSSIGSMYNGDGGGWGEVYASDPLLNLYERYPNDKRLSYIQLQLETNKDIALTGKDVVFFPVKSDKGDDFRSNLYAEVKTDAEGKYCEIKNEAGTNVQYRIKEVKVNGMNKPDAAGEYTLYYVDYDGEDSPARIIKYPIHRNTYPNYFVTKFSYQDGHPLLSSPVLLRWAEVVLNRAEANAKLGHNDEALADVNAIRQRAGLSGNELFATGNMHGYTNVLDVVLDERRMELAFEGHRRNDVYRNKLDMDRRYPGTQPWEVIPYTADKIQYPIPYNERSVSGIEQNPGY